MRSHEAEVTGSFQEPPHLVRLGQQVVLFDHIQLRHGLKAVLFKECGIFGVEG